MKTAALIIGILSVCTFTSCRCNIEEEEPKEKTTETEKTGRNSGNGSEKDTLNIR